MPVETYKAKRIFIHDPEHYGLKRIGSQHYIKAQIPFVERFLKERYGLSIKNKQEDIKLTERDLNSYGEEKDEEGLTPSERFKLEYAEKFLSGKFEIASKDKKWAEEIREEAEGIKEHLVIEREKKHKKGLSLSLEHILQEKAAMFFFVISILILAFSIFSRISTTGYAISASGAANYSLIFALLFFIVGIIVFILRKKKKAI